MLMTVRRLGSGEATGDAMTNDLHGNSMTHRGLSVGVQRARSQPA